MECNIMQRLQKGFVLLIIFLLSSTILVLHFLSLTDEPAGLSNHHHYGFVQQQETMQMTCTKINQPSKCNLLIDPDQAKPVVNIQMHELYNNLAFDNRKGSVWAQGWDIADQPERWTVERKLKVILNPFSHNDPGWTRTFDEYYYGTTMFIFSKITDGMQKDPNMKFVWAEISFFAKWYNNLAQYFKNNVNRLIERKQLEFVTGGWVMADEANSHWYSLLQQLAEGQTWLKTQLNYTVRTSWSIDPFGLSPTMPYILKKSGFDNLLIQRTHYEVKRHMASKKALEFRWRQLFDAGEDSEMFTHMMPFPGYSISLSCGPDPIVCCQFDFRKLPRLLPGWKAKEMPGWLLSILRTFLPGYRQACPSRHQPQDITADNVDERSALIVDQWRKKATLYQTNVVLIPLGDDFRWSTFDYDAQKENYDKLIKYINQNPKYNMEVKWGTSTDYFDAVRAESRVDDFPSLSGDFYTYADRDDHYWSGYFTSRPYHKRLDRTLMTLIRSAEMLHAWCDWSASGDETNQKSLTTARQAHSLFQHHDGITGTAADHVMIDYTKQMMVAIESAKAVMQHAVYRLLVEPLLYLPDRSSNSLHFSLIDPAKNHELEEHKIDFIQFDEGKQTHYLVVHNSLPHFRSDNVEVHVSTHLVTVLNSDDEAVPSQIIPVIRWVQEKGENNVPKLVENRYRLVFRAQAASLDMSMYTIKAKNSVMDCKATNFSNVKVLGQKELNFGSISFPNPIEFRLNQGSGFMLANKKYHFSSEGLLQTRNMYEEFETNFKIQFLKYGVRWFNTRSGAYLFLPNGPATPLKLGRPHIVVVEGSLQSSVAVHFPFGLHEIFISGNNGEVVEVRNTVDIRKMGNTEVVMRISTQIDSKSTFYTDLNAMQMIKHERYDKIPLQGNFYPVPSAIYIEDTIMRLTVLLAQPLGGSSLRSGEIEIVQDRRLDQGDERGLGQGVQDNRPTLNIFRLDLALKDFKPTIPTTNPAGYLTPSAYQNIQSILYPFDRLLYMGDDWRSLHLNVTDRTNMDATIQIVSLRHLPHLTRPGRRTVGVIVHRTFLDDCGSDNIQRELNFRQMLGLKSIEAVYKAPLTLLQREDRVMSFDICPMDTQAFIIDFQ